MTVGTDASADFECQRFECGKISHPVYCTGEGPAVILMHEVAGLSPVALELGKQIADAGYRVLMPMFYGSVGQDSLPKGVVQLCIAREFTLLRTNRSSKVTAWLQALAQDSNDGRGVAAIGMCLTGGLVLGLLLEEGVRAGVASQPSLPFAFPWSGMEKKTNLGLEEDKVDQLIALQKPLLALRFKHDRLCPGERLEVMAEQLGAEVIEVPEDGNYENAFPRIPDNAHAVLTYHHVDLPEHPSDRAFTRVFGFLGEHLPTDGGNATQSAPPPGGS